jgi:MFS family permease
MALVAAGLAAAALAPTMALLLAGVGALAFGQGMASPSMSSLISHEGGAGEQGRVLGVYQSLSALGRVAGPVIGGVALQHIGLPAPFLAAALIAFAGALVLAAMAGGAA